MNGIQHLSDFFAKQQAFAGYLTVGDGGIKRTLSAARALIAGGVNILELGMPFSDPIADGPVITRAAQRAILKNTSLQDILWLITKIRAESDVPLILFSYLNPLLKQNLFTEMADAGLDGVLILDCPPEESSFLRETLLQCHLAPIYILTPSTPLVRLQKLNQLGRGFLYYVSAPGTTGIRQALPPDFNEKLRWIRQQVTLPILVGFGISSLTMAKQVLDVAEGVVVGSFIVQALERKISMPSLTHLIKTINPLVQS